MPASSAAPYVLVMDEDANRRARTCAVLRPLPFPTEDAGDAEAAWVRMRGLHPCAVVIHLDHSESSPGKPRLSGWGLRRWMLADPKLCGIPAVFIKGSEPSIRFFHTEWLETLEEPALRECVTRLVEKSFSPSPEIIPLPSALIVDDDPQEREEVTRWLWENGLEVDTASTGPEALEKLREPFDFLILAYRRPGMDGLKIWCQVRKDLGLEMQVMILLIDQADTDKPFWWWHHHVDATLSRPIQRRVILTLVERIFASRSELPLWDG
jgi:CheY-like chemotaxis protein